MFSSITLEGLLFDPSDGKPAGAAHLQRKTIPQDLVHPCIIDQDDKELIHMYIKESELPPRPPSNLPPSRQLHLTATLGDYLGDGLTSVVYALDNVSIPGLEPGVTVPQLVAKICRPHRLPWMAREAWFYEEMECIQGVSVPYCYGWFEMEAGGSLESKKHCPIWIKAFREHPSEYHDTEEGRLLQLEQPITAPCTARLSFCHHLGMSREYATTRCTCR